MTADALQVVIVEDHPSVRRGLEVLLPRLGFRVTGTAATAAEGERMLHMRKPDVAVVDIDIAGASGTELADRVSASDDPIPVVLYTGLGDPDVLDGAVHSGAGGIALKSGALEDLAAAIRAVAAGHSYVDPALSAIIGGRSRRAVISPREAEVLALLAQGLGSREVADRLVLSPQTVETHVRNAVRKLGARGRLHAVILALQSGDIELPDGGATLS